MVEGIPDRCRCQSNVALGQAHSGESGFWIPSGFAGGEEGLFRALEVTQLESDVAQLGEGPAELPPQVGSQFRACRQGFLLGFGGRPAQPKDLGPVHAATAMDAADTASVAPPLHRLGPLLSQVVLTEPLKHAHQLAVQHPGRGGIELTRDGRHPASSIRSRPSTTSPARITAWALATRPIAAAAGLPIDPAATARVAQSWAPSRRPSSGGRSS